MFRPKYILLKECMYLAESIFEKRMYEAQILLVNKRNHVLPILVVLKESTRYFIFNDNRLAEVTIQINCEIMSKILFE